jgi:hypothetical protein
MRRRVSREQLLDASQPVLSPRGNPRWRGGGKLDNLAEATRRK